MLMVTLVTPLVVRLLQPDNVTIIDSDNGLAYNMSMVLLLAIENKRALS
jgi:hypothetical protein